MDNDRQASIVYCVLGKQAFLLAHEELQTALKRCFGVLFILKGG